MSDLRKAIQQLNFGGGVSYEEPLSKHTSFRVGGPADVYLTPETDGDIAAVLSLRGRYPVFILGAGANILVADEGIRGIVLSMASIDSFEVDGNLLKAGAGLDMSAASEAAAQRNLSGLEFIYSMPGSVGGSVWMNARCYGRSISDVLAYADVVDAAGTRCRIEPTADQFDYKVSPFQSLSGVIVEAGFELFPGNRDEIRAEMSDHQADRTGKGHFAAPSAGSVFKNNRNYGEPSGKIIDALGLRGMSIGGAKISDLHANIIVNHADANARDIYELIVYIEQKVKISTGHLLEREVRLVGDWTSGELHE